MLCFDNFVSLVFCIFAPKNLEWNCDEVFGNRQEV